MPVKPTKGAISVITTGNWQATDAKPILQVLEIRILRSTETASVENKIRYRLVLSDGSNNQQGFLAPELNDLIRSRRLQRGSLVQLNEFVSPTIKERLIILILAVDVIHSSCYNIVPIASLNPYRDTWTIKARVTAKAEIRHYKNIKGEGKVLSFDLVDTHDDGIGGDEIRATCFNGVADQFYNQIEVGKVYFISEGQIKPAQKASYDRLKNDHEIRLDHSSTIWRCFNVDN